jgi:hypothetical protein
MAGRRPKQRIDYFSLEVDYYADPKFVRLRTEFGIKGEICAIRVLCAIYREGYFIQCSDDLLYMIADDTKLPFQFIREAVAGMVRCGIFDRKLFDDHRVLTSTGIQRRWAIAKSRSTKVDTSQYWLLYDDDESIDVNKNNKDAYINEEKEDINTTIKSNHIISHDLKRKDLSGSRGERAAALYLKNFGPAGPGALEEMIDFYGDDIVFQAVDRSIGKARTAPIVYVNRVCTQICNGEKEYKLNWQARNGE